MKRCRLIIICLLLLLVSGNLIQVMSDTPDKTYEEKLTRLKPDDIQGHYELGLWCLKAKLFDQAHTQFKQVIALNPRYKDAQKKSDEAMQSGIDARVAEIIKQYGPYKGVLDQAGTEPATLSWDQAVTKETEHFVIKTNASPDALNDACILMECTYITLQNFFSFPEPDKKLQIALTHNVMEFIRVYSSIINVPAMPGMAARFLPRGVMGNKTGDDYIVAYCLVAKAETTSSRLIHETTHYIVKLMGRAHKVNDPPIWYNEGLATYFESALFDGKTFKTNQLNPFLLMDIKSLIKQKQERPISDFINIHQAEYFRGNLGYAESWSFIYFLVNSPHQSGLKAYQEAWQNNKIKTNGNGNDFWAEEPETHLKIFEESMGTSCAQLEKEWETYITSLTKK